MYVYVCVCVCVCVSSGFKVLTSENSNAALSTYSLSDQTLDLGPISLPTNQSTETLFTCCRWQDDISELVTGTTCSPELQPRWLSGKKASAPENKGQRWNTRRPAELMNMSVTPLTSLTFTVFIVINKRAEEEQTDRLSEPVDDAGVVLRIDFLSVSHRTHQGHQVFRYRHLTDKTQVKPGRLEHLRRWHRCVCVCVCVCYLGIVGVFDGWSVLTGNQTPAVMSLWDKTWSEVNSCMFTRVCWCSWS